MQAAIIVTGVLTFVGTLAFNSMQPEAKKADGGLLVFGSLFFTGFVCTVVAVLLAVVGVR
jgi:hypothetical protein